MAVPKSFITDTELELLKLLWSGGTLSARAIAQGLYEEVNRASMGTVQKLIARLEAKGLVHRDRSGGTHLFSAAVTREEVAGMQLEEFAGKLSDGSLSPFVLHLVKARRLSEQEKKEIRQLLDQQERGSS